MKRICIITPVYPLPEYPAYTFVEQLVNGFADCGVECDVIAPYSKIMTFLRRKNYHPPYHYTRTTNRGNVINVYCPPFFCVAGRKRLGIDFAMIFQSQFIKATKKMLEKLNKEYDAFYGHFISPAAPTVVELGQKYNKPSYFAYGECSFDLISNRYDLDYLRQKLKPLAGVVAVSTSNRNDLITNSLIDEDKIEVFPNAIDSSVFYTMDRVKAREKLGIDQDAFIAAFVGYFIPRKGTLRVSAALSKLGNVKSFFIGTGEENPTCEGVLFKGRLPHDQIVTYLNAADIFVLPTLAEGCCNAAIEAMACGLPVISSDLPFNDDVLTEENSIRIDPNDVDAIAEAIKTLRDDPVLRQKMSEKALETAKNLTIQKRAENILAFMARRSDK